MSAMPNSGGFGGSCCRKRAIRSTSSGVISPEAPQFGMPAGEPKLMNTFRYSVPRCCVMSGVNGLPVAPLRSTPWHPAQRSKYSRSACSNSARVRSGAPGVITYSTSLPGVGAPM